MTDTVPARPSSDTRPVTPAEFAARLPVAPTLSSRRAGWHGIQIEHTRRPPDECAIPPLSAHLVLLYLGAPPNRLWQNRAPRGFSRRGTRADAVSAPHEAVVTCGNVNVIPAGQPSLWRWQEELDALHLYVEESLLARVAVDVGVDPQRVELIDGVSEPDKRVEHIGRALLAEVQAVATGNGGGGGRLFADSLAVALAAHLLGRYTSSAALFDPTIRRRLAVPLPDADLRRAVDFIQANLAGSLSLAEIARAAGYSEFHFARRFKAATNRSPHQYVLAARVERAARLLTQGRFSIAQAASMVGFHDAGHLARHTRRLLGIAPTDLLPHNRRKLL